MRVRIRLFLHGSFGVGSVKIKLKYVQPLVCCKKCHTFAVYYSTITL